MSAERRLKKTHATVIMALYQCTQEFQRKTQELQAAIGEQIKEWLPAYGLDPDADHIVEARPDGETYLVEQPKPAEPTEETEVDHVDSV